VRNVSDIIKDGLKKNDDVEEVHSNNFKVVSAELINDLFIRLMSIHPAYKQAWPTQESFDGAKNEWMIAFIKHKINKQSQIEEGLDVCRDSGDRFPPSVGEFIEYCQPKLTSMGVPTYLEAYNEAIKRSHPAATGETWSHAVVYHTWYQTGSRALNMATGSYQIKEMKDMFYSNYDLTLKMFAAGEPLRELPKLLNKPEHDPQVTSKGAAALKAMRDKL